MARRPNRPARIRPYFVKVICKRFSKKLLIPRKYVSLHHETLGKECVLWPTHTRESFRVRTKHFDNELYFKKGWKVFARTHSLKFGDLLIFRHVRKSEFEVDVLDMNGTPREPVLSENDHILGEVARAPPNHIDRQKNITEAAALTGADALISSSDAPFFKKIMKAAELKPGGYLYVPARYAKDYMKDGTKDVKIEYSDKVWIAKVLRRRAGDRRTFLDSGWSYLARESNIQEGDVCVFQLISTEDNTLKLTIFKNNNAGPKMSTFQTGRSKMSTLQTGRSKKSILQTEAISSAEALAASPEYPSFIKIMKPAYVRSNGCLHVPEHFSKKHLRNSSRDVKIKFLDDVWILRRQPSEVRTFLGGWSDLARKNSLQVNDVCVFQLINTKDCTLKLTIFKQTSGENQGHKQCQAKLKSRSSYSVKSKKSSKRAFEEAKESEALPNKAFKCGEDQKQRQLAEVKLESSDSDLEVTLVSKGPSPYDKALEDAKKFQSESKNTSFVAVMRPAYINYSYLHVPKTFVDRMDKKASGSQLKLQSSNCEMNAKLYIVREQYRINTGWSKLVKKESIKVGDACVLELVDEADNVIKVSVFKCNSQAWTPLCGTYIIS